jgi:CP family cyanate transporter-like MFS transporter
MAMGSHALAWQVTAFMGLQSLSYYATLSWFPSMFRDHGIGAVTAGNLLALMNVGNGITGLLVPVLAHRVRDQRLVASAAVGLTISGLAGSAFGPNATAAVFVCLLGLGQGATLGLAIYFFAARTADAHAAAELSGFGQGFGYLIASAGPLLVGVLHAESGGWALPMIALLVVAAGQLVAGLLAGRDLTVGAPRPPEPGPVRSPGRSGWR